MATQTQTSPARIGGSPGKSSTVRSAPLGDSVALTKRLQSELMSLMASADPGVSAFPDGDSLFSWLGTIQGAGSTVYEGLSYKLSLKFPSGLPPDPRTNSSPAQAPRWQALARRGLCHWGPALMCCPLWLTI